MENFESNDPKIWGPKYWFVMKNIASNFPDHPTEQEKNDAINFFSSFKTLLPCQDCRDHYIQIVQKNGPIFTNGSSKTALVDWVNVLYTDITNNLKNKHESTHNNNSQNTIVTPELLAMHQPKHENHINANKLNRLLNKTTTNNASTILQRQVNQRRALPGGPSIQPRHNLVQNDRVAKFVRPTLTANTGCRSCNKK